LDREVFQEQFGLIGDSHALRQVIDKIAQVAPTDITVLIEGESGVGKDLTARAIHGLSQRKQKDLVIVNCGAIPEGIIESELFGHEKGAFTGAHEARQGYFEKADGGTIFLDEIGDTPKNVQVKLLRILETGEFFRVGSSQLRKADVRVIAATNKNLWQGVLDGSFREDLYYRLDTVKIRIPPLRERSEDIIPIFRKFVSEYATKYDSVFQGFSDEARELLTSYRWPGNIRELRNVAEQLVVLEKSQFIDTEKLKKYLKGRQHLGSTDNLPILMKENRQQEHKEVHDHDRELIYRALVELRSDINDMKKMLGSFIYNSFTGGNQATRKALPSAYDIEVGRGYEEPTRENQRKDINLGMPSYADIGEVNTDEGEDFYQFFQEKGVPSLEETEKYLIQLALKKFDGNRRKASEALGISERTLYRKLDQYELG
jgi:DNA-binding NtrC family response regulator